MKSVSKLFLLSLLMLPMAAPSMLASSHMTESDSMILEPVTSPKSQVKVSGTANVTSWEATSSKVNGRVVVDADFWNNGEIKTVNELSDTETNPAVKVSIPAKSLKSGSSGMDEHMHSTMNVNENPKIRYRLNWAVIANTSDTITMQTEGNLTVAGGTSPVSFPVTLHPHDDYLRVTGQVDAKFTDFGMEPPTAMLGSVWAHDAVTLSFEWNLAPKTDQPDTNNSATGGSNP